MKRNYFGIILAMFLLLPSVAFSVEVVHSFDTVTSVTMHHNRPSVTGIEKDTGNQITVSFVDNTNVSYRYVVNRCVPVILTALEKPGRYFLYLTVDVAQSAVQLRSCRIEVKI